MTHKSRVLEQSEQSTFFNVIPSHRDERDWNAEPLYDDVTSIPKNLDWRTHLQKVRNQGLQGTSLACVGTSIVEWYSRKIKKEHFLASPQFIHNNRPNMKQTLMCGRDLMEILKTHGCCKEESYQYGNKDATETKVYNEAQHNKIDGYARIRTMDTLKKALIVNGPCLVCFPVYNHTTKLWKQRQEEEKLGCHAMAIVGYNRYGFIARNSWGEHWNKRGYCVYPYEDWGCHDEIWTVVNEDNIKKWKLRIRNTVVKRVSSLVRPSEEMTPLKIKKENNKETIPGARDKVSSSQKVIKRDSKGTLQDVAHEYQEFDNKEKVGGTNDMKKSFFSSMFGKRSLPLPETPKEDKEQEKKEQEKKEQEKKEQEKKEQEKKEQETTEQDTTEEKKEEEKKEN
jgi:hypothetical protein